MRLFLPQFQEYRQSVNADRTLHTETMDEAFAKLAALVNGNLDASNISKTAAFPVTAFLEPNSVFTMKGIHSALSGGGVPTRIEMGVIPTMLNGVTLVPVAVGGILFYSTIPGSVPTFTVNVGATVVASGTTTQLEKVTTSAAPRQRTIIPPENWRTTAYLDPVWYYEDIPEQPGSSAKYKVFSNYFSSGVTPATGNVVYATISPNGPQMQSFMEVTFKVRLVS